MSKISVTTIAGLTSGGDANKVKIESGDTLEVVSNATVGGTLTTTGAATFQGDMNVGTTTNLLSNGDFTTNTNGWAATGSTLAINSGNLQLTPNSGVNGFANQQVDNLVVGKSYVASVAVTVDAGNYARLYIGTSANGNQTVNSSNLGVGTHSFTFIATATTHHFALVVGGGTGQVTRFDNARLTEASRIIFPAIAGTSPEIKQGTSVNDLAISTGAVNRINVSGNGEVTMPSQPAFLARLTSAQDNIATGATTNIAFNSEVFDQNSDYNTSNYTFTAPVDGKYMIGCNLNYTNWDSAFNYVWFQFNTSNALYYIDLKPGDTLADDGYMGQNGSLLCDMDAGDTVTVQIAPNAGSAQMDIITTNSSQFYGYLVA